LQAIGTLCIILVAIFLAGIACTHSWMMFTHYDPNQGLVDIIAKLNELNGNPHSTPVQAPSAHCMPKAEPSPEGVSFDLALLTMASGLFMRAAAPYSPIWNDRFNKIMLLGLGLIGLAIVLSFFGIKQIMFG